MMMKYIAVLLTFFLSFSIAESEPYVENNLELSDFLDLKAGKVVGYNFQKTSVRDFRSKLPYHFFEVPLPKKSILRPVTHFNVSIHKETSILHSKAIELPLTKKDCKRELKRYKAIFKVHGFTESGQLPSSIIYSEHGLINKSQILTMACETSGSSPFRLLRIVVTTIKEHEKFEETMRNFRG